MAELCEKPSTEKRGQQVCKLLMTAAWDAKRRSPCVIVSFCQQVKADADGDKSRLDDHDAPFRSYSFRLHRIYTFEKATSINLRGGGGVS